MSITNQKTYDNIVKCFNKANKLITISWVASVLFAIATAVTVAIGAKSSWSWSESWQKHITIIQWAITAISMSWGYLYRFLNMKELKRAQHCVANCSVGDLTPFIYRISQMRKALILDSLVAWTPLRYISSLLFTFHYRKFKKQLKELQVLENN